MQHRTLITLFTLPALLMLANGHAVAQADKTCIQEIIRIEKKNELKQDTGLEQKNLFMTYTVRVTNWDDEVVTSHVKLYQDYENMHFFSEQATIYRNKWEALMILPEQKLLILNSTTPELNHLRPSDEFMETRRGVLENSEVLSCGTIDATTKRAVLRVHTNEKIKINTLTYDYAIQTEKINSVKSTYDRDYKLKEMVVVYTHKDTSSTYKFLPLKSYFQDKKGVLLAKYKGYEVVDNRDQKSKQQTPRKK